MTDHGQHVDRDHPILAAYAQLDAALSAVEEAQAWSLNAADTRVALFADTRVRSQLEGLGVKVVAHAHQSRAADDLGATPVGGRSLVSGWPATRPGPGRGRV